MIVTAVFEISPAITPAFAALFQKRERRRGGLNDAPSPPHANRTS